MLNFKKTSRVIVVAAVALVAVLIIGFAVNRVSEIANTAGWETYDFPDENFEQVFFKCAYTAYNPEYICISAQLTNNQNVQGLSYGKSFTVVKQVGKTWKVVPFANDIAFEEMMIFLENGMSVSYHFWPDLLAVKLDKGRYRIVTDIYHQETEGEEPVKHTVWADFTIDKKAPKQKIIIIDRPDWYDNWFVNFDGKEMSLDDLREIAKKIPELTVNELFEYNYVNASSSFGMFNLWFSTEYGSLNVCADSKYKISRMTFKIQEADMPLDLLAEPERLDDYINGEYVPFGANK